ncbi:c-type cytochrome [Legionella jamestowniensis]|nr:c-type cytochrome [Legionella jamestowniensis]
MSNAAEQTVVPPAKTAVCVACHGQQGVSLNPVWPNIAGQHASYILKQLQDYKKGTTRNAPEMTGIVATLNESDMAELATFYAKQPLPEGVTPQKYLKRGEQLYRGGDFEKHIAACIACHGPRGTGNAQAGFPVVSGQHAPYTIQQLQAFKENKRSNDLNSIMRDISARMSQEDMEAVAYYMQGLH